jgi:ABC-2 type transport system permease protein/oleandomycin transport system permease protein
MEVTTTMKRLLEVYLVAERNLRKSLRTPQFLIVEIFVQPIIFVLLFAFVFGGAIHLTGVSYIDFLLPGILVQTATFAGLNTGIALADDLRNGLMDRFWSLPMSRFAVIAGRIVADTLLSSLAVVVMIGVGTLIGFRFHAGLAEAGLAITIAVLTGMTFATLGALLAVIFRTPEGVQGVGFALIFPIVFASSVFVPVATMPVWLQAVASRTPITAAVDAVRALSLGLPLHALPLTAVTWLVAVMAVAFTASSIVYRRMGR